MSERAISERELLSHLGWVRGLALTLVGDVHRADDLTQEVCRTALEKPPRQAGPVLRAWLRSATRLLARNEFRGLKRQRARETRACRDEATPSTFDVVARNALVQRVSREVMALAEPYRSTVLYRYLDGLTPVEIAAKLGIPAATLRKRLSRGLEMLRVRLERAGIGKSSLGAAFALPVTEVVAAAKTSTVGAGIMISKVKAVTGLAILGGTGVLLGVVESPPMQGTPPSPVSTDTVVAAVPMETQAITSGFELQDPPPRTRLAPPQPDESPASDQAPKLYWGDYSGVSLDLSAGEVMLTLPKAELSYGTVALTSLAPLPDGYHVGTHDNGKRSEAGMVKHGQRVDEWAEWHTDGSPRSQGSYVHGRKHGRWTVWGTDGQVRSTGEYVYAMKEGDWAETGEDGRRRTATYRGGKKYGIERVWHDGGEILASETSWYADKQDGPARTWYESGQLESRGAYVKGDRTGLWEFWLEDGAVDEERTGIAEAEKKG